MHRAIGSLALLVSGCAGVWVSSDPLYPADWPALVRADDPRSRPDLTGTYRAVSDPAGPLEYPPGGHPREMFMFVTYGPPVPAPRLGRRVLAWHLAGAGGPADEAPWSGLERFAAALGPDGEHPDGQDDVGWVEIADAAGGGYDVRCGVADETLLEFALLPADERSAWQKLWSNPTGYEIEDGALHVWSAFPGSPVERSPSAKTVAAGEFAFRRAVDGSLVMLESLFAAPAGGEVVFRKWWRWRPIR